MSHLSEDELETYLLGRLVADPEVASIEEHLLICAACINAAQFEEHTIEVMRECLRLPVPKRKRTDKVRVMTASQGRLF